MNPMRYFSLINEVLREQGIRYEDLSKDEQQKLLLAIPEIHQYLDYKVKETLGRKKN